jgi:hypothetical protein
MSNNNNYVSARSERKSEVSMTGEIMPQSHYDSQSWATMNNSRQTSNVDPLRKGLEFNLKYATLTIAILILTVGITMRTGQDFSWGLLLLGLLLFFGYWILGISENFFDRDSGHVVWAFFGWLVERNRAYYQDRAHERSVDAEKEIRLAQIVGYDTDRQLLAERRSDIENRHALPQSTHNRMANYEPVLEHPPVSTSTLSTISRILVDEVETPSWLQKPVEKNNGGKALTYLLDFVEDVYEHQEWVNAAGLLLVGVPWSKNGTDRNGANVPSGVKRQIIDALSAMTPPLFSYVEDSRQWRLNTTDYSSVEDAYTAIDETPMRKG